jgi:hypothetical protein
VSQRATQRCDIGDIGSSRWAVITRQTRPDRKYRAGQWAVEATRACRTICHIDQTCRRRICAGWALQRSVASHRTVVTGRAYVVDRGVLRLHAGLADVADLEARLTALVRRCNRAAATAEIALAALGGGCGEPGRTAVRARRALRALADILEAVAVAVGAVGTKELRGEAGASGAVTARWAMSRVRGVLQAVGSGWACLCNKSRKYRI